MTPLYVFPGPDNLSHPSSLIQGADGNFYGLLEQQVFKVTPGATFALVYDFTATNNGTLTYLISLIHGEDGNLYGLTRVPGLSCPGAMPRCETIFQSTRAGKLAILYTFPANAQGNVQNPISLFQASDGNFYGATSGVATDYGSIFEFPLANPNVPAKASTGGVVNVASGLAGIGGNAWMTIYGTNLAMTTDSWANTITGGALSTKLDGVSVMVGGQPAYIQYVSAAQINALAPNIAAAAAVLVACDDVAWN